MVKGFSCMAGKSNRTYINCMYIERHLSNQNIDS
jgi:hypothetical protein